MRLFSLSLVFLVGLAVPASAQSLVGLTSCCPNEVVAFDAVTGDTTTVATIGTEDDVFIGTVGSLVLDSGGNRAFAVRNGRIATIDLTTGAVVEGPDANEFIQLGGYDSGRGVLYVFATRRDTLATAEDVRLRNFLVAYDPATQDTTHLAQIGEYTFTQGGPGEGDLFASVTGPAMASADALYTVRNFRLLRVDLASGTLSESTANVGGSEIVGLDGTWLYRTDRQEVTTDTTRTITNRLLRQPLAGGPDAPADTVSEFGFATIETGTGGVTGDVFLASFGMVFYDAAGDRVLFNRNFRLYEVALRTATATDLGPVGNVRYIPSTATRSTRAAPLPTDAALGLAASPNPSRGAVQAVLTLRQPGEARVTVWDALGRRVAVLHEGGLAEGDHTFVWSAERAAPGVYVLRASTARGTVSVSVTLAR